MSTQDNRPASILLVEDEENLQEALKLNLEMEGFEVSCASDGAEALKKVEQEYFDLIILDVMLPELDGISVCESIRLQRSEVPILMLSAKNSGADRVLGLKKGADDYMTKPFNLEELLLRVQKLIEKNKKLKDKNAAAELYAFGKHKIDFKAQEALLENGETVQLSKKESMLLKLLIEIRMRSLRVKKFFKAFGATMFIPPPAPSTTSFSTSENISKRIAAILVISIP